MRHKWAKMLPGKKYVRHDALLHYVASPKECVKCKLKKGYVNSMGFYPKLVYFKDNEGEVLSVDNLPYQCMGADNADSLFLSEGDFEL